MFYLIIRQIAFFGLKAIFKIQIEGKKNIPKKGGFILVSNHVSYLDPVALGAVCPRKLSFMARHDLFFNPFLGWLISRLGAFPVKRNTADLSSLREAIRRLKNGRGLLLFPEGSRSRNGIAFAPQPGVGFLAARLNVPVIPAFIKGSDEALPKGSKFFRFKPILVRFGAQISLERRMPYQDIAMKIMENIRHLSC